MSLIDTLDDKLKALSETEFQYIESNDINRASELDHGCTGLYMEATVVYFEIKNPNYIIKEHGRRKMAQLHTMLHEVLVAIAEQDEAFVNCYSPMAFLIAYPGKEDSMRKAVAGAMKIVYALTETFKEKFSLVAKMEFGMGLDHGHIMGTKTLLDHGFEQLTWFGTSISKAIRIAKESARPYHIGISSIIYHNLDESLLITTRRIIGIKKRIELWTKVTYQYENVKKHLYQTNHKINFQEAK